MAVVGGTAQTYQLRGNREDLTNMIWRISPFETPFVTAVGRTTAKAVYHEWQTDTLATPGANAQVEGDDIGTYQSIVPTVRLGNYTQILRKSLRVSGTADVIDKAGRDDEHSMQLVKLGKELRMDVEYMCVGTSAARSAGSASTPRISASVHAWLKTNTSEGATGADPAGDGTNTRTPGTGRAFTGATGEAFLKTVLASIWTNSNDPARLCLVNSTQKYAMSTFVGNATRYVDAAPEKIYSAVERYVHDFGDLEIRPDRICRAADCLIINPDLWKVAWLRPIFSEELAKQGDSRSWEMIGECTLEARNEAGSGAVFDLT